MIKNIGIVTFSGVTFENMFQEKNTFFSLGQGKNPMHLVRQLLAFENIMLWDVKDKDAPKDIAVILYFGNIDTEIMLKYRDSINVYVASEPPSIDLMDSKKYLLLLRNYFDYILSWNDDLIDNEVILKFNFCVDFFKHGQSYCFEDKKLLTNISANKRSRHKDELYSQRLKVINYFEDSLLQDFEFYGKGWDERKYKNYRGSILSKLDVYSKYKFALCLENQKNINGYITEKILDCFICNIVPIYQGARNIEQYIPKKCYIDYSDFPDVKSLTTYLRNMPESEYKEYINSIECFLDSSNARYFTPELFSNVIERLLNRKRDIKLGRYKN